MVAIVLVVGSLFVVPLAARRPVLATTASVVAAIGYPCVASSDALVGNLGIAVQRGWLIPAVVLGIALVVLGLVLRPRFAGLSLRRRLELSVAFEALLVAALVLASRLDSTPELAGRYLLPFAPGVALAIVLLTSRGGGSRGRSLIVASVVALGLYASLASERTATEDRALPLVPSYSQRELETVASELDARGHSWTELVVRLQGRCPGTRPGLERRSV